MAEFGDALSTALTSQNEGTPSIFEVLAQENLGSSIRPAIKHVIKTLAENSPHIFAWSYSWFDEFYTAFELAIQHHFLKHQGSSFAEHYYDLTRKLAKSGSINRQGYTLDKKTHFLSLVSLVLLPYILLKCDDLFNKIKEKVDLAGHTKQLNTLTRVFYWLYPILHGSWQVSALYYNFMFAMGRSDYHSPVNRLLNIRLIIVDEFLNRSSRKSGWFSHFFTNFLTGGVHAGVFVIQFMEWWYDEDNHTDVKHVLQNPIPDVPRENQEKTLIPVPKSGICPLCNRPRRNETALMTSGYVFCYVCAFKYVQEHTKCPVTGYYTKTNHLIKIYPPT